MNPLARQGILALPRESGGGPGVAGRDIDPRARLDELESRVRILNADPRQAGGLLEEALGALADAVERLEAEEEQRRVQTLLAGIWRQLVEVEQRRYGELFESICYPCLVTDPRGSIREANAAAGRVLGTTSVVLRGTRVTDLVEPVQRSLVVALVEDCLRTGQVGGRTLNLTPESGPPIPVGVRASALVSPRGEPVGIRWHFEETPARSGMAKWRGACSSDSRQEPASGVESSGG